MRILRLLSVSPTSCPIRDLRRGHILTLPAERVPNPVRKEVVTLGVFGQQISGAEVLIALHENVGDQLLIGRLVIGVTGGAVVGIGNDMILMKIIIRLHGGDHHETREHEN